MTKIRKSKAIFAQILTGLYYRIATVQAQTLIHFSLCQHDFLMISFDTIQS